MRKNNALGRGLSAILGTTETDSLKYNSEKETQIVGQTLNISLNEIETNPFQPRTNFDQERLHELATSIEQLGIIQPITVRKLRDNKYQLISGERRFRASQLAGLEKIPAFVRIANDQEMLEMALVENIQRENLNPIEVALSYQRLIEECKLTQEACSKRVGKNRTTITNFLRLLKLPSEIQDGVSKGTISTGHARALVSVADKQTQINIYHDTVAHGFSVREVEQLVKEFAAANYKRTSKQKKIYTPNLLPFIQQKMVHDLSRNLNKEIKLKRNKKGKGTLTILFDNDEELTTIFTLINK